MSHQSSVLRTAPIAIAPKPPRPEPSPYRQNSFHRLDIGPSSLPTRAPADSSLPPCLACRYSRANCVMSDDEDGCIPCQVNGSECSLASSPQSRKRKLHGDSSDDIIGKRRSVSSPRPCPPCPSSSRPFPPCVSTEPISVPTKKSPVRSLLLCMSPDTKPLI